jgi:hypothetical protein
VIVPLTVAEPCRVSCAEGSIVICALRTSN